MDLIQAMNQRHAVRSYIDKKIEGETAAQLQNKIAEINEESGLKLQLVLNEEKAFGGRMAHYGHSENVRNYVAVVGSKGAKLSEKVGYYGEKLVLFAQTLGLNTCWVALSYDKTEVNYSVDKGEKLALVIAIGYGSLQGVPHKSKYPQDVCKDFANSPEWFKNGVKAALLAPTAINQQKFSFELKGDEVIAKPGIGFYTKVDLGIAEYHFELGAGKKVFNI